MSREVRLSERHASVAEQRVQVLRLAAYNAFEATAAYQEKLTRQLANTAGTVTLNRANVAAERPVQSVDPRIIEQQPVYPAVQPMPEQTQPDHAPAPVKGLAEQFVTSHIVARPEQMPAQVN